MKYPKLKTLPTTRDIIDVFKGYNHNLRIGSGEFYDMTNLSSDNYPVLSPRKKRGIYRSGDESFFPQGLLSHNALCYVDGSKFVIGNNIVEMDLDDRKYPKTLISMGAYVIIMPDRKYINTLDYNDKGNIEATVNITSDTKFSLCKIDSVEYDNPVIGATEPENPENTDLWMDTSTTPHVLKIYSNTNKMWSPIATTYIKISATGIGIPFSANDGVTISGVKDDDLQDLNATTVIWAKGDDYIVVKGIIDQTTTQAYDEKNPITIKRQMPIMNHIIESGNRLWGCRYGPDINGNMVNEIYASKLGDFKNWNCFAGISTDSYVVTVGTEGPFTGATTYFGYPIFFKENYIHKVYGNYPANYQIQTTTGRGVQYGCQDSIAMVNETLYYKSRNGVCAFDGSLPYEISDAFGGENYDYAVAGSLGNKYYISMRDMNEKYHLFVYDKTKDMWHREDDTQALCFCNHQGDLFYIDYMDNQIKTVVRKNNRLQESAPVKWQAVTGVIGTDSPDKKYISRMDVRMMLEIGASVGFFAEYDSSGEWEHLFTMTGKELRSFSVPIRTRRCDHLRLKIVGDGDAKILSICKTIEQGSGL